MEKSFKIDEQKIQHKILMDKILKNLFLFFALLCSMVIVIVVCFILYKGIMPFFTKYKISGNMYSVSFWTFLTGTVYHIPPNVYGVGYIIVNTIYCVFLSLLLAIPCSIFSGLFISRIAPKPLAHILQYVIEMLASIPSIIFGLFGMGVISIFSKNLALLYGKLIGHESMYMIGGSSTLSVVLVLAFMILPTLTMMNVTAFNSVKQEMINGSLALGASVTETNFKVVLPASKSGVFAGIILGVGRALGEATAISMVCGNQTAWTFAENVKSPFDLFSTTNTLTTRMLLGIHEVTGLEYDIRFSMGIFLIILILVTNRILNMIKKKMEV